LVDIERLATGGTEFGRSRIEGGDIIEAIRVRQDSSDRDKLRRGRLLRSAWRARLPSATTTLAARAARTTVAPLALFLLPALSPPAVSAKLAAAALVATAEAALRSASLLATLLTALRWTSRALVALAAILRS
jgi:hypothetical protein